MRKVDSLQVKLTFSAAMLWYQFITSFTETLKSVLEMRRPQMFTDHMLLTTEFNSVEKKEADVIPKHSKEVDKITISLKESQRKVVLLFGPWSSEPTGTVEVWYANSEGTREEGSGHTLTLKRDILATEEFATSITKWLHNETAPQKELFTA